MIRNPAEFSPWVRKIPWKRAWQPTPASSPGESHGRRSPAGYSHRVAELNATEATSAAQQTTETGATVIGVTH